MAATSSTAWQRLHLQRPLLGMLHLPALPGSPGYAGDLEAIAQRMLDDAAALVAGGVDGLILENFGDAPFFPGPVPPQVVAHMTALACRLRRQYAGPLGINVLRNDGLAALAVAHAAGGDFIRVNVLCGARVCDQGLIQGIAHDLLRQRRNLAAGHIAILADVDVKHSAPLGLPRALEQETADLLQRGGADAVIVSGAATGAAVDPARLAVVKAAAGDAPVLVGSGVSDASAKALLAGSDGLIVGSFVQHKGQAGQGVDRQRLGRLMLALGRGK